MYLSTTLLFLFPFVVFVSATLLDTRGQTFHGQATYYATGLGACGGTNSPGDFIVALNQGQYGGGGDCYKPIIISDGKTTQHAQIVDECMSCGFGSLDMSKGLFKQFNPTSVGTFPITWWFADSPPVTDTPTHTSTPPHTTTRPPPTTTTQPTTTSQKPTTTTTSVQSNTTTSTTTSTTKRTTQTTTPSTKTHSSSSSSSTTSPTSTSSAPTSTPSYPPDGTPQDGNIQLVYDALLAFGNMVRVAAGQI